MRRAAIYFAILTVTTALFLGASLLVTPSSPADGQEAPEEPDVKLDVDFSADWKEVDRLLSEDKFEAASAEAARIREAALQAGDAEELTRALVKEVRLRTALHGHETAVRFLMDEPWPEDDVSRSVLDLFFAHTLVFYHQTYAWEIGQRERVDTGGEVDLKRWTREQIFEAAQQAYLRVWERRESWGAESVGEIAEYVRQNSYPARIRGTLRDAVSYLWVELLVNTSFWRPEQHEGVYRLDLERLMSGAPADLADVELADASSHPLEQVAFVLADLEAWHRKARRPEAAFEARRERLVRLAGSFDQEADLAQIRAELEGRLEALGRRYAWWSKGMASVAELVRRESDNNSLVRAREIAQAGEAAHPSSVGGQHCRHIVADIEAPDYGIEAMSHDGPDRRSVEVTHRNLSQLYFRAYRLDLFDHLSRSRDYNMLPGYQEVPKLLQEDDPEAEWSVELPPTPDFRDHRTFVTPPISRPGLYVVVASARRDFETPQNRFEAVNMVIGDLVMVSEDRDKAIEVTVYSGRGGTVLADVDVHLYRFDWQEGHRRLATVRSGADGKARIDLAGGSSYFLVAERGEDVAIDLDRLYSRHQPTPVRRTAALVYTDRSVYRPNQPLLWKVIVFRGGGVESRFETLPSSKVTMDLLDANGQVVASENVKTNGFGTASGRFEIPAGRLLGSWHLRASYGARVWVRVEEYKRPTFEVSLKEPEGSLRLNRPATLQGEARYYFGLPVTSAEVGWRVVREPVYPYWWSWYGRPTAGSQTVAAGEATLGEDGGFRVSFVPEADEREAKAGVTYSYRLDVDVTDEGGETRSASRAFRLGFVAVTATVSSEKRFFLPDEPVALAVRRTDLDGTARPGKGRWRLVTLRQPEATALPADQPLPSAPGSPEDSGPPAYETAGDRLRPRWEPRYTPEAVLRLWGDGDVVASGRLEHGAQGVGKLELDALRAGAYRLLYETADAYGAHFETRYELVVARAGKTPLELPAVLLARRPTVRVGETARLLVHSGLEEQDMVVELHRRNQPIERFEVSSSQGLRMIEIPIGEKHRGGFGVTLTAVRDHQFMRLTSSVFVPWDDRELRVEFDTFRDRLRPGATETWKVRLHGADGKPLGARAAEVLAYMYDRSLDLFAPHTPVRVASLYPNLSSTPWVRVNLGDAQQAWFADHGFASVPGYPALTGDALVFYSGYGVGGLGRRARRVPIPDAAPAVEESLMLADEAPARQAVARPEAKKEIPKPKADDKASAAAATPAAEEPLRSDFSETAFFHPHLLTEADGSVSFEFEVPDSVTEWNVWVHAVTRDLAGGVLEGRARSVKELMVRPYLPRFLREGDRAELKIVVNNAGDEAFSGRVDFALVDAETGANLLDEFGLTREQVEGLTFEVEPGGGADLTVPVRAPVRVGSVAVEVRARAAGFSDGERRLLPLLPGRLHLAQSRFATLNDQDRRVLRFEDLANAGDDPTLIHDQLVVTLDAQLFYGVLNALPYLVEFPYECTEQTLNRFVSTGIVSSVFEKYPAVARMAEKLAAKRDTRLETWQADDPNRKMALVETPWLVRSRGGEPGQDLIKVLDPRVAKAQREAALVKLRQAQTSLGAFPWWPGGPPSPYMTLYLLYGFSKALEFEVDVPQDVVQRAWGYMHRHYVDEVVRSMMARDCCWEFVTFLNYTLSNYPDESWTGGVFTAADREEMLAFSFRHWRQHSPLSKAQLALTLHRMDRAHDARLVFDSIMDSSKTTEDQGTFWAPEDRAWLWYNDTIEGHSFALRALTELDPGDARRHGLVQWLLINRKLNHWKSTRATAEVIYALVHYLDREGALGVREAVTVAVGPELERDFVFEPEEYSGSNNQVVVPGSEVTSAMAEVVVEKETKGFLFASATWHFSTEELPDEARGDFFEVHRRYFRRVHDGTQWTLQPLEDDVEVVPGDQVEVHLSIRTRHAAEYVHLRDPRGAGFEPDSLVSRFKWQLGLGYYEEVRDSGTNFFFEWLPAGEYTFKYRLRASLAGKFRVGPATLQSMYAPEFTAYSAGEVLAVDNPM